MSEFIKKYDEAVRVYVKDLKNTGSSAKTVANYCNVLRYFGEHWGNSNPQKDPCVTDIRAWRDSLFTENNLQKSTVKQYLKALSAFFCYCSDPSWGEDKIYKSNPVAKRLFPQTKKEEQRPYDILMPDEKVALLWKNECISNRRQDMWPRNYAIVVLLLSTELRNGELLDLTPNDIDWDYGEVTVERGKGNKYRIVDLPEIAKTAIQIYLSSGIRPEYASDDEPLFGTTAPKEYGARVTGNTWHKGTTQWLSGIVERHVKAVTGISDIRTHDLRHIGARLDLNNGARAEFLQMKLGHASLTTTQIYSGRLTARRGRESAKRVFAERDIQATRNELLLKNA